MPDIIVIGAGPGGTAAATRAAQLGAQVTLIERAELGGNCVNRNCIPLLSMLSTIELLARLQRAEDFGITVGPAKIDPAKVVARARQISADLREGLAALLPTFGIDLIEGQAKLTGPKSVAVNGHQLQAQKAVILATGASWATPPAGIEPAAIWWPHEAMTLAPIPERLLIWGGSAVELEFATLYRYLGSQVTVVIDGPHPLPGEDYEVGQRLQGSLSEQGIEIVTNASLKSAVKAGDGVKAVIATRRGETELTAQKLLWAGRTPNSAGLGLEAIGLKLKEGAVEVDERQQTRLPGLFALGDLIGPPYYSSVATVEGLVAAENALGRTRSLNRSLIPRHAFTIPEVGCVGLTEEQAEDAGYEVEVINIALDTSSRAVALGETDGGVKIVANKKQGKILGVHIVGHRATELVAEAALAIQLEALAEDWAWSMRIHPTLSETMPETGRAVLGQALYIPQI